LLDIKMWQCTWLCHTTDVGPGESSTSLWGQESQSDTKKKYWFVPYRSRR